MLHQAHKPWLTSFSETLALFFIQFLFSFISKIKIQNRENGPSKSFRAYQKKNWLATHLCIIYKCIIDSSSAD